MEKREERERMWRGCRESRRRIETGVCKAEGKWGRVGARVSVRFGAAAHSREIQHPHQRGQHAQQEDEKERDVSMRSHKERVGMRSQSATERRAKGVQPAPV